MFTLSQRLPGALENTIRVALIELLKIYIFDFLQRGRERDRELEISMTEKHPSAAFCTPLTEGMPATKAHALDWNGTWDLSVHRPMLYLLNQTSYGNILPLCVLGIFIWL